MKSPNNSGPGLALTLTFVGGVSAGLWLHFHPFAWPHALIASAMTKTGHPVTAPFREGIGAGIAAVLCLIPGLYWEEKMKAGQRRRAARRAAKEAEEVETEREKTSGAAVQVNTRAIIDAELGGNARPANHATPRFVLGMVTGAGVIFSAAYFYLTHF